jgi:hypothetical protein
VRIPLRYSSDHASISAVYYPLVRPAHDGTRVSFLLYFALPEGLREISRIFTERINANLESYLSNQYINQNKPGTRNRFALRRS